MPGKKSQFIGRKNELEYFRQILLQRGFQTESRVILIHGHDGIGKTALATSCMELAKKARWQTVAVDWAQNTPHNPTELLSILTDVLWKIIGDQQVKFLEECVTRIEGVQSTVERYQEDHPEIWQKMLAAGTTEDSQTLSGTPQDDAEASDDPRKRLINYMHQQKVFPRKLDTLVLSNPSRKLAQAMSESLVKGAGRRGLVVWFDGCEYLPPEVEVFLRDDIICPAVQKNAKLHFILSGSSNQFRERSVSDAIGTLHRVKGYGDLLYSPPPLVWNIDRMVDPEVKEYLKYRKIESDVAAVEMMQQFSQGVPILLELIADAVEQQGLAQVQAIFAGLEDAEYSKAMSDIVQRFVENYPDPTGIQLLYGLAVLLSPNDAALASVCSLSEDDTPGPIKQKLSDAYAFVYPDGRLHDGIRIYLRRYLQSNTREYAQFLGHNAAIHYQTLVKNFASQQVEELLNNQSWQSTQVNLINALCWTDERRAIKLLAASVLESALFEPAFGHSLITLTREFRFAPSFWSAETCQVWDILVKLLHADIKVRLQALEDLAGDETQLNLSDTHLSIQNILLAQIYNVTGQPERAVQLCDAVSELVINDSSIERFLASAYSDAGVALGFNAGEVVASELALHAFKRALALGLESTAVHYGLGCVLAAFSHMDEAADSFSKVLAINPKHANTIYQRGMANYSLGKYPEALNDFSQSLNFYPGHARAAYYRGMCYAHMGDQHKALADFSKAISLDSDMVQAYVKRGEVYTAFGQLEKALADFSSALERDPGMMEIYAKRGETYIMMEQPENAVNDLTQALSLIPGSAALHVQRGSAYANLGQYPQAVADFNKALEVDPALHGVYAQRGDCYKALAEFEYALADFSQALAIDPDTAPTYTKRGAIYAQLGRYDEAMADFTLALELDPQQPEALIARANMYVAREQYEDAAADYEDALALDPSITGIEAQRGLAFLHLEQYDQALANLRIAAAASPGDAVIIFQRGLARYNLGQYDEALSDFRDALTINPQLAEVYIHRAKTHVQLGKPEQALIDFGQAIAVDPHNAEAYYNRGSIRVDFKQYAEAITDLDRAIELDQTLADAFNKRGLSYANLNKIDEALQDYAQAIALNPRDASVYNNRGNIHAMMEKHEEALLDYTQAITRDPQIAEAFYNRGNILTEMGQFDNAIADFSQAISLDPNIDQAYYNRGNTYAQLGQLENALVDLDRTLINNPRDTAALNNRGNVYADLGKPDLALADYARALEINPQLGEVYTNRGLTYADTGQFDEALADYAHALSLDSKDATATYYSACAFGLLQDESQACVWLEQAILLDEAFRTMAADDPDFDAVRSAPCFRVLVGDE